MWAPFTSSFPDAVTIAHTATATVFTAIVWSAPLRPRFASVPLLVAVWLAASVSFEPELVSAFGVTLAPDHVLAVLKVARWLAVLALTLARPRALAIPAAVAAYLLGCASEWVRQSDFDLAGAHLIFIGAMYGLHVRFAERRPLGVDAARTPAGFAKHDAWIFMLATAMGGVVSFFVLERFCNSGDEWAYTFQADLFAHLKAYGVAPSCPQLFQNYWVFYYMGRAFQQYTPGWPLVMAPFQRVGLPWLAAPVVFGSLAVALARLGRRIASGDPSADAREVRLAGMIAALSAMLSACALLNAGSRYPHVMVTACFAWAVEATCVLACDAPSRRAQIAWGFALGSAASLMVSARHGDGTMLGGAIFLGFAYSLLRRRIGARAFAATTIGFFVWAGLTLVILRLQLGVWFKTGYSISDQYFSFGKVSFGLPGPEDLKVGIPLAIDSYSFFPVAPMLAAAGSMLVRGRARLPALMLAGGALFLTALYVMLEFGRHESIGYGPRYVLPTLAPLAVLSGPILSRLFRHARARAAGALAASRASAVAAGVALLAFAAGVTRIAPLIYPMAHAEVHTRRAAYRAIEREHLHNAVVTVAYNELAFDPMDLTQNFGTDPNPDVVILIERDDPKLMQCGLKKYPDRTWWRARGKEEVTLERR